MERPIEIVVMRVDATTEAVEAAGGLLCDAEQRRAARFAFERDRRHYIAARGHLRRLLAARLQVPPRSIDLVDGPRGKPSLAPQRQYADLRFSVSHAHGVAAYAFAWGRDVGVDIERVLDVDDADAVAARFLSSREHDAYCALDVRSRQLTFFNAWTRKEALVKAIGDGLHLPLDRFEVPLTGAVAGAALRMPRDRGDVRDWQLWSFAPASGFVGAVVAERLACEAGNPVLITDPGSDEQTHTLERFERAVSRRATAQIDSPAA